MTVQLRRMRVEGWLVIVILPLMVIGCQLGIGARVAPTPVLPATPLPLATPLPPSANTPTPFETRLQTTPRKTELTKVIDGYLHVRYLPPVNANLEVCHFRQVRSDPPSSF